ncbi:TAXI family TRAP transporter solute-binding subunit [uncultured Sneathiella sp.]|uniref:TAXI family TRAP transporter solute-binding subunit n=1 Tax=uncultured Sneathiella sp. TaxID=879315 RepID=UPI0030EE81C4|tara:strand:- start:23278 stop:24288 length:1011 start_codon:yes stop_codon:yes gene_type:complete
MYKLIHKFRKSLATAAAVVMLSAGSTAQADNNITILGGPVGGGWYMIASGMAEIIQSTYPELVVRVVPGGGLVNPPRVGTGDADFALSLSVNTEMAMKGGDPYEEAYEDIRSVAWGFNTTVYQVVAREEVPVNTFDEIISEKFAAKLATPGMQTMGGWTVKKLFNEYDVSIDDVKDWGGAHYQGSHSRSGDLLRDGQANILMTLLPLPAPNILEVSNVRKLKFLPMSDELMGKMVEKYGYGRGEIPVDAYKGAIQIDKPIPALTIASGLIANANLSDEVVYKVTKALMDNADRVRKIHRSMVTFVPGEIAKAENRGNIGLHPGAQKYFEEAGINYQ